MLQMESNMKHVMAENDFATNGLDGMLMVQDARWAADFGVGIGYKPEHGYEVETHLGRFIDRNQWFQVFVGFDWNQHKMLAEHGNVEKNIFGQKTDQIKVYSVQVLCISYQC
jgi:hypothetical protein